MKKLGIAASLVGLSLIGAGCKSATAEESTPAERAAATPAVQVIRPTEKLEHAAASASGQLRSLREATLSAKVSGTILRIRVEVGDRVKEGQPLVELDDATARANAALARAAQDAARSDLRLAELELERVKQLVAGNAAPKAQLDRAQATHDSARAQLARASASLAVADRSVQDHLIRAPFAGVITSRRVHAGESVSATPPTALVSLVDLDHLEVRLEVPEAAVDALRPGAAVSGTVSPSGRAFEARVKALGAAVDPKSRTVEVLLSIPAPKDGAAQPGLRPGALVNVQLASRSALAGPFLPNEAVRSGPDGTYVWVVEDGVARRRGVDGTAQGKDLFRVAGGLNGQEAVVLAGGDALRDGMAVRAVN
jgi:RND family efflux transporter MFP subunit